MLNFCLVNIKSITKILWHCYEENSYNQKLQFARHNHLITVCVPFRNRLDEGGEEAEEAAASGASATPLAERAENPPPPSQFPQDQVC